MISSIKVFTLPRCPHCEQLKSWLARNGVQYEEALLDTDTKVELIMHNIFSDPPILQIEEKFVSSSSLMEGEALNEPILKQLLLIQ